MKPLSGSGARGMMVDAMKTHGADSFIGRLVSVIQGSTDTTFYILAVYFGSVNIKNTRYALAAERYCRFGWYSNCYFIRVFILLLIFYDSIYSRGC